jgi:hypothetical protein
MRALHQAASIALVVALASPAAAQLPPAFELPWNDRAPEVDAEARVVRTAAVGAPDERVGRFEPRRASARRAGRARAIAALHGWLDEALSAARVGPREAVAAHAAVDRHARVEAVRPRVDGAAVVVVTLPLSVLREACPSASAPWGAR